MDGGARVIALRAPTLGIPPPSEAAEESHAGLQGARRNLAIACVLGAMALVVHSAAVVHVALPALATTLQVTPAAAVRVITVYQLALLMALLPCAAIGESVGYRRVFTAGLALFTCASALCALAPALHWLLAARFLQGLGGAAVMALGVALLRFSVPQRKLAAAIGWNALTVALSSAAGPTTGALLLSGASLPWLFAVHVPIGAAVLLATPRLPAVHGTARNLDGLSIGLSAAAFASLVVGVELMPAAPATGALVLGGSGLLLTVLVRRELPKEWPLVPLDLLRARSFRVSAIASVCCFAGQAAALVALPFHLQQGSASGVLAAGLMITPWPLSVAVVAPLAGRLADRLQTAWLCAAGGSCLALGLIAAALSSAQHGPLAPLLCMVLCGAGFGLFQVPNNRNMLLAAPRTRSGAAGAVQGTARLVGQTLGAVLMTLLFVLTPTPFAPRVGLGMAAVLTLSAALVSTMRATPRPVTTSCTPGTSRSS